MGRSQLERVNVANNTATGMKKLFLAAAAVVASYSFAPTVNAALLVDFKP